MLTARHRPQVTRTLPPHDLATVDTPVDDIFRPDTLQDKFESLLSLRQSRIVCQVQSRGGLTQMDLSLLLLQRARL